MRAQFWAVACTILSQERAWYEVSKQYAEQVRKRLSRITPGDPLEGAPEQLLSAPNTAQGRRLEDVKSFGKRKRTRRTAAETQRTLPHF